MFDAQLNAHIVASNTVLSTGIPIAAYPRRSSGLAARDLDKVIPFHINMEILELAKICHNDGLLSATLKHLY